VIERDRIQFSVDYVKKFLNRLRTSCTVSITTVLHHDLTICVSKKWTPAIFWHELI